MTIVIFSTIIGALLLFLRIKSTQEMRDDTKKALSNEQFTKFNYSKGVTIFQVLMILSGIGATVYGFMIKDYDTSAVGIIIAFMFIGELIVLPSRMTLYYNDRRFLASGKLVRYKSIKDFAVMKYVPFGYVKVITINGDEITVSRKAYHIIKEHYDAIK